MSNSAESSLWAACPGSDSIWSCFWSIKEGTLTLQCCWRCVVVERHTGYYISLRETCQHVTYKDCFSYSSVSYQHQRLSFRAATPQNIEDELSLMCEPGLSGGKTDKILYLHQHIVILNWDQNLLPVSATSQQKRYHLMFHLNGQFRHHSLRKETG